MKKMIKGKPMFSKHFMLCLQKVKSFISGFFEFLNNINLRVIQLFKKNNEKKLLIAAGYSKKAVAYYFKRPYMGAMKDAQQITEIAGSCGDTMRVFLKIDREKVTSYQQSW